MAGVDAGATEPSTGPARPAEIDTSSEETDWGTPRHFRARRIARAWVWAHVLVTLFAVGLAWWVQMPAPGPRGSCPSVLKTDDLLHLPLRAPRPRVAGQLQRWADCDRAVNRKNPERTLRRARDALRRDALLIATITLGFGLAVFRTWRRRRSWRPAAIAAGFLAATYLAADIAENAWLWSLLNGRTGYDRWLHWAAAIKFGAFLGALPVFVVSFANAVGEASVCNDENAWQVRQVTDADTRHWNAKLGAARSDGRSVWSRLTTWIGPRSVWNRLNTWIRPPDTTDRIRNRLKTWANRTPSGRWMTGEVDPPAKVDYRDPPPGDDRLGICCSGGGIRSAAFNLGALQALQSHPSPRTGREAESAEWLSAVSGGSYLAAAWVTGRRVPERENAWERLSAEEDHLRRHAAYLAPGLGGKLWALTRFLLGFLLNLGLIGLAVGVVFLPFGWLVGAMEDDRPMTNGVLELPQGGCLELSDGAIAAALPGARLHVAGGSAIHVGEGAPLEAAGRTGALAVSPVTCPAPTKPAPSPGREQLAAGALGRQLDRGARVPILLDEPLKVSTGALTGCRGLTATPCTVRRAKVFAVPPGSLLAAAPEAVFELGRSATVVGDGTVARQCGTAACQVVNRPHWLVVAVTMILGATLILGLSLVIARTSPATSAKTERWAKRLATITAIAVVVVYVLPTFVLWAEETRSWLAGRALSAGLGGSAAVLIALALQVAPFLGAGAEAKLPAGPLVKTVKRLGARLRPLVIRFIGAIVGPLLVLVMAIALASYASQQQWRAGQFGLWLGLLGPLLVLGSVADLNEWSLHPFYRDRLRTAFAVDPVTWPTTDPREDPLDSFAASGTPQLPRLLICAAANLADDRVTAPGRPVASWVFEAGDKTNGPGGAHIGSDAMRQAPLMGSTDEAPGTFAPCRLPPRLAHLAWTWTAVGVSGAAFSPAMGKMTTPERFLLAIGNLRLGVWYPNPRYLGGEGNADNLRWYEAHTPRPWYIAKEALGVHRAKDRWIYVTDGGHYENLGFLELLRRGCRQVYCFDASGDRPDTFGTLAEAMRLAREELRIEIAIDPDPMKPDDEGVSPVGVRAGTITFKDDVGEPSGWFVIAKLAVPKTAPFDVIDLARTLPSFPNSPTADQLYTDQKFEAYRALGSHLGDRAFELATEIRRWRAAGRSLAEAVAIANGRVK